MCGYLLFALLAAFVKLGGSSEILTYSISSDAPFVVTCQTRNFDVIQIRANLTKTQPDRHSEFQRLKWRYGVYDTILHDVDLSSDLLDKVLRFTESNIRGGNIGKLYKIWNETETSDYLSWKEFSRTMATFYVFGDVPKYRYNTNAWERELCHKIANLTQTDPLFLGYENIKNLLHELPLVVHHLLLKPIPNLIVKCRNAESMFDRECIGLCDSWSYSVTFESLYFNFLGMTLDKVTERWKLTKFMDYVWYSNTLGFISQRTAMIRSHESWFASYQSGFEFIERHIEANRTGLSDVVQTIRLLIKQLEYIKPPKWASSLAESAESNIKRIEADVNRQIETYRSRFVAEEVFDKNENEDDDELF